MNQSPSTLPNGLVCSATSIALSLLLLSGCATSPDASDTPDLDLPTAWTTNPNNDKPEAWLKELKNPELNALVAEALQNNADLQLAAGRFHQAIAEARIAGADQLPTAGLGLNGTRQKINSFGPSSTGAMRYNNYDLSLNLSWEIDVWGKLGNRSSAAIARVEASQSDLDAARMSLVAQVTKSWLNLIEAKRQLSLSQGTASADRENLSTVEARFKRGLAEGLEVRQIRTQKALSDADVETRKRAYDQAARSLEVLLGRYPKAQEQTHAVLPELPSDIPSGIPAQLLTRRPDLVASERQLAATGEELLASKKDLLPSISLTASGGSSSQEFQNLLDSNFSIWSLGANLTQPIFQGGRILGNIDRNQALKDQATANYRSTALQAFLEVESTLAAERFLLDEHKLLKLAVAEALATKELAWKRYRDGTSNFLNYLSSQRSANAAQSRLIHLQNLLLQNRIDLYLALGGPFETES